ncbi:MAG: T9SS type A sorting domain-containing protein [Sphingobacteriales bacterium]|nr:MAG: T9SS type A sorting domain-containing protein [Sphingobacteriales bacterium]
MFRTFCLSPLLHCLDTEWAIRLLVGTYVDEHLYEQALVELQSLPNTPENAEFIALYQAIIEGGLEGSGKANIAATTVNNIAENTLSKNSALAQSVLAVCKSIDYIRHGATINLLANNVVKIPNYKLVPNPAQDQLIITFRQPIKTNQTLEIYNLQGQLVVTQKGIEQNTLVNVAMLRSGIYFCRLSDEVDVVKLVIVR